MSNVFLTFEIKNMEHDVQQHFQNIQQIIRQGKTRALAAATAHALDSYWTVGAYLSQELSEKAYGKNVVNQLSEWLQSYEPGLKGFDRRSLYRMRAFFEAWHSSDWSLLPSFMQESKNLEGNIIENSTQKIVVTPSPQSPNIPSILLRLNWSQHMVGGLGTRA
jgi:hypothetical protein